MASTVLLLAAVPAGAAPVSKAISRWTADAERLLTEGKYEAALGKTTKILGELGGRRLPDGGDDDFLGETYALHAVALSGSGEVEEAEWFWYVAQSLKRDLRTRPLDAYGEAGEKLDPLRYDPDAKLCRTKELEPKVEGRLPRDAQDEDVTPPRATASRQPQYTPGARRAGVSGLVMVQTVIDRQGRLVQPCVLRSDSPILTHMLVDGMRTWTFEPGRVGGEPVDVVYNLTTSFSMSR